MDSVYSLRIPPILRGWWGMLTEQGQEIKPGWGLRSVRDLTSCFLFILHKLILRRSLISNRAAWTPESKLKPVAKIFSSRMPGSCPWAGLKRWEPGKDEVDWRLRNSSAWECPMGLHTGRSGDLQLARLRTRWVSVGKGSRRGELLEEAAGRGRGPRGGGGVGTRMAQGVWNGVPRKYGLIY